MALGSLRWYLRLAPGIDPLLKRPQALPREIRALLIVTAHQIEYSRNVVEATVHAAVDATRILRQERSSAVVNAVLRRFVSERQVLLSGVDESLAARTAHPAWLVQLIQQAWPDAFDTLLAANNGHPPMVLRVDLSRRAVADYLQELAEARIAARPVLWIPSAVHLEQPVAVREVPGFSDGIVSVQDAGAQLAATLLDVRPRMRVLDACAAPGGKTGHILESAPELAELVAVDIDAARVLRIKENLERLRRTARLIAADVREPASFWDGVPFERILLDAPCSSTGVIRRHPDIKLLRRPADIAAFAATQLEILGAAFRMLAHGGRLLYSTCSVLPEENEDLIGRFLASEPAAKVAPMPPAAQLAPGAKDRRIGIQLLPGAEAGTDGFYYACLEKTTAGT